MVVCRVPLGRGREVDVENSNTGEVQKSWRRKEVGQPGGGV